MDSDSDPLDLDGSDASSIEYPIDRPLSALSSSSSSSSDSDNVEVEEDEPRAAYVNPPSQDHDYAGAATASEADDRRAMDERLERTEREEREADEELRERKRRFALREEEMRRDLMVKTLREKKHRDAIESMREEIRKREESIREMWDERIESERLHEDERDALDQAKAWASMKREARRKAMKEADEHPYSQSLRYSRGCAICLTANPRRRAVMIKCGHMTCLLCAEQLVETGSRRFPCPFCRKRTKYVKTFENVDAPQARQQEIAPAMKRKTELVLSQKSPVVNKRKRFTIQRFVLNQRTISNMSDSSESSSNSGNYIEVSSDESDYSTDSGSSESDVSSDGESSDSSEEDSSIEDSIDKEDSQSTIDEKLAKAERDEKKADDEVNEMTRRLKENEDSLLRVKERARRRERDEMIEIARLREQIRAREECIRKIRGEQRERERELSAQKSKLKKVIDRAKSRREARRKLMKAADDHPLSHSLRYTRSCTICLAINPRKRAFMVACGHMTCLLCAERLSEAASPFPCPFCRQSTTYVKAFEDLETTPEARQEAPNARKRGADPRDSPAPRVRQTVRFDESSSDESLPPTPGTPHPIPPRPSQTPQAPMEPQHETQQDQEADLLDAQRKFEFGAALEVQEPQTRKRKRNVMRTKRADDASMPGIAPLELEIPLPPGPPPSCH